MGPPNNFNLSMSPQKGFESVSRFLYEPQKYKICDQLVREDTGHKLGSMDRASIG